MDVPVCRANHVVVQMHRNYVIYFYWICFTWEPFNAYTLGAMSPKDVSMNVETYFVWIFWGLNLSSVFPTHYLLVWLLWTVHLHKECKCTKAWWPLCTCTLCVPFALLCICALLDFCFSWLSPVDFVCQVVSFHQLSKRPFYCVCMPHVSCISVLTLKNQNRRTKHINKNCT